MTAPAAPGVVDVQIGIWTHESPQYPWDPEFGTRSEVERLAREHQTEETNPAEVAIARMDAVGVAVGVVTMPLMYAFDPTYAVDAALANPGRIFSTPNVNFRADDVDGQVHELRNLPGVVGGRIVLLTEAHRAAVAAGAYDRALAAAERNRLPVLVFCPHALDELHEIATRFDELQLIVDHFGLAQPPLMPADPEPFGELPKLLRLAGLPNVAVKFSGAPTLSAEPYPFSDLWPHLHRVVDAFRPERLLWASDYPRVRNHTYQEALDFVRETSELSTGEKAQLLGETARRLLSLDASGS